MALGLAQTRELALLILYQRRFNPTPTIAETYRFVTENGAEYEPQYSFTELNEDEWQAGRYADKTTPVAETEATQPASTLAGVRLSEQARETVPTYLTELVAGVETHREAIDTAIDTAIHGDWSVARLEQMPRLILEIAVFEMQYVAADRVPPVVAVDQAVTLAKIYTNAASRRFINGVLSHLLTEE